MQPRAAAIAQQLTRLAGSDALTRAERHQGDDPAAKAGSAPKNESRYPLTAAEFTVAQITPCPPTDYIEAALLD